MNRREIMAGAAGTMALAVPGADTATPPSRHARGLAALNRVTGQDGQAVVSGLADIAPDLGQFIVDFAYGEVISREGIDLKTRELATVAALAALGHAQPQLKVHVRGALNVGASRGEIVEVLVQTAVYAGFPAALNALSTAREAFREAGV